ncbi:hypothetical protein ACOMHN_003798 [Nucella lapillus]
MLVAKGTSVLIVYRHNGELITVRATGGAQRHSHRLDTVSLTQPLTRSALFCCMAKVAAKAWQQVYHKKRTRCHETGKGRMATGGAQRHSHRLDTVSLTQPLTRSALFCCMAKVAAKAWQQVYHKKRTRCHETGKGRMATGGAQRHSHRLDTVSLTQPLTRSALFCCMAKVAAKAWQQVYHKKRTRCHETGKGRMATGGAQRHSHRLDTVSLTQPLTRSALFCCMAKVAAKAWQQVYHKKRTRCHETGKGRIGQRPSHPHFAYTTTPPKRVVHFLSPDIAIDTSYFTTSPPKSNNHG